MRRLLLPPPCSEGLRAKHFGRSKSWGRLGAQSRLGGQKRDRDRKTEKTASGSHLAQRLELGLHDELVLAELATARVRTLDPLLQAGLVDEAQAARAVARRDQGTLVPFTVANPAGGKQRDGSQCWGEREDGRGERGERNAATPKGKNANSC